jgi:hypothetical protein
LALTAQAPGQVRLPAPRSISPLTTIAVTVAPVTPARFHSVALAKALL